MTTSELTKKISEAADLEWFKNVQETFNFQYVNFILPITGVSAIYEFVNQQLIGWELNDESLHGDLDRSKTYFADIKNQIIHFVNNYLHLSGSSLNNGWIHVKNQINNIKHKPLPFNVPETEFLIRINKESPTYFQGAYDFLLGTNNYNVNSRENFFWSSTSI